MKQIRFLRLAKDASQKSDHHTHKMGCVIAKSNKILGVGYNAMKTHPKSPHAYKSIHAEFMAIVNAGYDIKGSTVYVFRQQKDGTMAIAKPCSYCWEFLIECGAKEVIYSFEGSYKNERLK